MGWLVLWIIVMYLIFRPGRKKKKQKQEERNTQETVRQNMWEHARSSNVQSESQSYERTSSKSKEDGSASLPSFRRPREKGSSSEITFCGLPEGTDELEYLIRNNREYEKKLERYLENRDK